MAAGRLAELLQSNSAASQGLLQALLNSRGITGIVSLWIINGLAVELTPEQILELPTTRMWRASCWMKSFTAPAVPQADPQALVAGAWDNLGAINAPAMWSAGVDGRGVVVATMDSGVDSQHPDLAGSWRGGANSWYDPHGQHASPYDATGHGTQTMGIIVGGSTSGSPIGVAPGAKWIAVKMFDDGGQAAYSDIHLGFQWLLDPDGLPDTADAPHVVNNSWGLQNALNQCVTEFQQDVQTSQERRYCSGFFRGQLWPRRRHQRQPGQLPAKLRRGRRG